MKKVIKHYSQKTKPKMVLRRKQQGDKPSKVYQLYLSASCHRLLNADRVDIYVEGCDIIIKPRFNGDYKVTQNPTGGAIVSASSLVAFEPAIERYSVFYFKRRTEDSGYYFSPKVEVEDEH